MEYCAKSELHPASAGLGMLKGQLASVPDVSPLECQALSLKKGSGCFLESHPTMGDWRHRNNNQDCLLFYSRFCCFVNLRP